MEVAITIIMTLGAIFIAIFSIPNLIHVIKTKNTLSVNLWMYLILLFSCCCFATYGLGMVLNPKLSLANGLPVMIANICCITICCITLYYKFSNMARARAHKMTELEYWEKHDAKK